LTGKWVKARYVAERPEIATRYVEWEIIGPREIREVDPDARYFTQMNGAARLIASLRAVFRPFWPLR